MILTIAELKDQLEKLSANDRADLVDFLLATLPNSRDSLLSEKWDAEIKQRREEMISGQEPGIPLEEVIVKLREKFS